MLLGVAFVPAITSIVVAVLVAQIQRRTGGQAERELRSPSASSGSSDGSRPGRTRAVADD